MISTLPSETTSDPRPLDDVGDLLACVADYLLEIATHFVETGRHAEACLVLRVGLEAALRARFVSTTNKPGSSCLFKPEDCLATLRSAGTVSRRDGRRLARLWAGKQDHRHRCR